MVAVKSALQHSVEQMVQWLCCLVRDSFDGRALLALSVCGASGGHLRAGADVCLEFECWLNEPDSLRQWWWLHMPAALASLC